MDVRQALCVMYTYVVAQCVQIYIHAMQHTLFCISILRTALSATACIFMRYTQRMVDTWNPSPTPSAPKMFKSIKYNGILYHFNLRLENLHVEEFLFQISGRGISSLKGLGHGHFAKGTSNHWENLKVYGELSKGHQGQVLKPLDTFGTENLKKIPRFTKNLQGLQKVMVKDFS